MRVDWDSKIFFLHLMSPLYFKHICSIHLDHWSTDLENTQQLIGRNEHWVTGWRGPAGCGWRCKVLALEASNMHYELGGNAKQATVMKIYTHLSHGSFQNDP